MERAVPEAVAELAGDDGNLNKIGNSDSEIMWNVESERDSDSQNNTQGFQSSLLMQQLQYGL